MFLKIRGAIYDLNLLKKQFEYKGEVKWRYFAPDNSDSENPMLKWDLEQKEKFRFSVFEIITSIKEIRLICSVCET